jgi:hypothetical protein
LAARAAARRGLQARKGTGFADFGGSDLASRRRRRSTGPRCAGPGLGNSAAGGRDQGSGLISVSTF